MQTLIVWKLTTVKFSFHPLVFLMECLAGCKNKKEINYLMFEHLRIQDLRIDTSYAY